VAAVFPAPVSAVFPAGVAPVAVAAAAPVAVSAAAPVAVSAAPVPDPRPSSPPVVPVPSVATYADPVLPGQGRVVQAPPLSASIAPSSAVAVSASGSGTPATVQPYPQAAGMRVGLAAQESLPDRAPGDGAVESRPTCTQAQLRRFIKSRPWVPMHELRRRFGIYGSDDDVSAIRVGGHTLFIGLPQAEGWMIAELLGGGDVGYELSLDPCTPVVVGVYPMRPVPRS
jgi:hypothetical protein